MGTNHVHRICTYAEAEQAIRSHEDIYVNDCFCRAPAKEGKTAYAYCGHPVETCMGFHEPKQGEESFAYRKLPQQEALALFEGWRKEGNLFRFMEDENWICFCCACGCGWFRDQEGNKAQDPCLKSPFIETTNQDACTLCGECVDLCAYDARKIEDDAMVVTADDCYGCGACEFACPEDAIEMAAR